MDERLLHLLAASVVLGDYHVASFGFPQKFFVVGSTHFVALDWEVGISAHVLVLVLVYLEGLVSLRILVLGRILLLLLLLPLLLSLVLLLLVTHLLFKKQKYFKIYKLINISSVY